MPTIDRSKRRYLLAPRDRDNLTPSEQHELRMADAAYGHQWWMSPWDQRWVTNASAVAAFHSETGRWPRSRSADAGEQKLGTWLAANRNAAKQGTITMAWNADREQHLNAVAPGWQDNYESAWQKHAQAVADFHRTHGRWPSSGAKSTDEKVISRWLANIRSAANNRASNIRWTTEREQHLNTVAPGWRGRA